MLISSTLTFADFQHWVQRAQLWHLQIQPLVSPSLALEINKFKFVFCWFSLDFIKFNLDLCWFYLEINKSSFDFCWFNLADSALTLTWTFADSSLISVSSNLKYVDSVMTEASWTSAESTLKLLKVQLCFCWFMFDISKFKFDLRWLSLDLSKFDLDLCWFNPEISNLKFDLCWFSHYWSKLKLNFCLFYLEIIKSSTLFLLIQHWHQ